MNDELGLVLEDDQDVAEAAKEKIRNLMGTILWQANDPDIDTVHINSLQNFVRDFPYREDTKAVVLVVNINTFCKLPLAIFENRGKLCLGNQPDHYLVDTVLSYEGKKLYIGFPVAYSDNTIEDLYVVWELNEVDVQMVEENMTPHDSSGVVTMTGIAVAGMKRYNSILASMVIRALPSWCDPEEEEDCYD